MIDLCWNICASASRWFHCTRLHWNCADRKCFLLPSLYFHDLTIKKSISNHVSLCQGMRSFIGFPITITKPSTNHVLWIYHQNQTQQTMYFVFIIKTNTSPSPVTMTKSHGKLYQNYFRVTTSPVAEMREEIDHWYWSFNSIKKKMTDFDYCEEYLTSISSKMLLWQCSEKQREKLIQTFILCKLPSFSWGFKKKKYSSYYH